VFPLRDRQSIPADPALIRRISHDARVEPAHGEAVPNRLSLDQRHARA
jgi:hypothetical protein